MTSRHADLAPGPTPRYRLGRRLGRGGSGCVFAARDVCLDRPVAVKVVEGPPERAAAEAAALAGVRFPGVVRLLDVVWDPAAVATALVFRRIRGRPFVEALLGRPLDEWFDAAARVLRALAFVHQRGLVHRDLKPQNILVSRRGGEVRPTLLDFGLAAGGPKEAAGTLPYLAPEVAAGEAGDARSDLFSLGLVFLESLGGAPRRARDPVGTLRRLRDEEIRFPGAVARRLPRALVLAVESMLRREPALRAASADEVLRALSEAAGRELALETAQTLLGRAASLDPHVEREVEEAILAHEDGWLVVRLPPGSEGLLARFVAGWAARGRRVWSWPAWATTPQRGDVPDDVLLLLDGHSHSAPDGKRARPERGPDAPNGVAVVASEGPIPSLPRLRAELLVQPPEEGEWIGRLREALRIDLPADRIPALRGPRGFDARSAYLGLRSLLGAGALRVRRPRGAEPDPRRDLDPAADRSAVDEAKRIVASLGERERLALGRASLVPGPLESGELSVLGVGPRLRATLVAAGLLERTPAGGWRPVCDAYAIAAREEFLGRFEEEAARTLEALVTSGDARRRMRAEAARVLWLGGRRPRAAARLLLEQGRSDRLSGHAERARRYLEPLETAPDTERTLRGQALRWLAECALLEHRLEEADGWAERALAHGIAGDDRARVLVARARAALGRHDRRTAEACLAEAGSEPGVSPETAALVQAIWMVSDHIDGDFDLSIERAERFLAGREIGSTTEWAALLHIYAVALMRRGRREDLERAASLLREAEEIAQRAERADFRFQLAATRAQLIWRRLGRLEAARTAFEELLNREIGSSEERSAQTQLLTYVSLLLEMGDLTGAREALERFRAWETAPVTDALTRYRELIGSELELRSGRPRVALEIAARVAAESERCGDTARGAMAHELVSRARLALGQVRPARLALARALRLSRASGEEDLVEEERRTARLLRALTSARGSRPKTRRPRAERGEAALAERVVRSVLNRCVSAAWEDLARFVDGTSSVASEAADEARPDLESSDLPAAAVAAAYVGWRALDAGDMAEAEARFEQAKRALAREGLAAERVAAALLEAAAWLGAVSTRERVGLDGVREQAVWLDRARRAIDRARRDAKNLTHVVLQRWVERMEERFEAIRGPALPAGLERYVGTLERLVDLARSIALETDPDRLLEEILDEAVALVGAKRGFVILRKGRALEVRAARHFAEQEVEDPERLFSRTIAERVARTGEPVAATDVLHDPQLRSIASIYELSLTSVVCVPLREGRRVVGSLYLDDPQVLDRFDRTDVHVLRRFGDIAGLALAQARRLREQGERARELARAKQEIERLNRALADQLESRTAELDETRAELEAVRREAVESGAGPIVARSESMLRCLRLVERLAASDVPVLIQGESGTGKELLARRLHRRSPRSRRPLVTIDCAALSESLAEAELFGYVRGAFTGASRSRKGLFEIADGGTVFLDEIGELSPEVQKRLLRVVQSGEFHPLGAKKARRADVRIVASSRHDLRARVREGAFREDLFYRIAAAIVRVPPLRERFEDIDALVDHFAAVCVQEGGRRRRFPREVRERLRRHSWPGNVRELQNVVRTLLLASGERGPVRLEELPFAEGAGESPQADTLEGGTLRDRLREEEIRIVREVLRACGGNKSRAAKRLGVSVRGLYKILDRHAKEAGMGREPRTTEGPNGVDS